MKSDQCLTLVLRRKVNARRNPVSSYGRKPNNRPAIGMTIPWARLGYSAASEKKGDY